MEGRVQAISLKMKDVTFDINISNNLIKSKEDCETKLQKIDISNSKMSAIQEYDS